MCDYSLHAVANRPAKARDKIVTTSFVKSATRGFAAVGEPTVAVCLLPGTEVVFDREAEYDHIFGALMPSRRKLGSNVARFRHVNVDEPTTHHDALEFANGRVVLVTRLRPGQQATVIQLPASAEKGGKDTSISNVDVDQIDDRVELR